MNKLFRKAISFLLIVGLLLQPGALAVNHDTICETYNIDYEIELPRTREADPNDVFNIYIPYGAEYSGYIFILREGASLYLGENDVIKRIISESKVFHAASLDDIRAMVDPEKIDIIEPNWLFYLDLPEVECASDDLEMFSPRAFAPRNDPRRHEQWGLEMIRGAAVWTAFNPSLPANRVTIAVIDTGLNATHVWP